MNKPKQRKINMLGKDITIAKVNEIEEPKLFNLKAVIKKTSCFQKSMIYTCLVMIISIVFAVVVLVFWFSLQEKVCSEGFTGISCQYYNACWAEPCEGCVPLARNSRDYTCTCGIKSSDLSCNTYPKRSASYSLIELKNGSLASGYDDNSIVVWRDDSLKQNIKLVGHVDTVKSLTLVGEDLLTSGSCDETIKVWNLTTGLNMKNLTGHQGCVNSLVSFKCLNRNYLISGSEDGTIRIWNHSFGFVRTYGHSGPVLAMAYEPNSKYIAIDGLNNTIDLYSVSLKLSVKYNSAHNQTIRAVCVLNDDLIASSSQDKTIKIWKQSNQSSLELVTTLNGHNGWVYTLAVLNNGSLISGSGDRTVKVWNKINDTLFVCVSTLEHDHLVTSLLAMDNLIISGTGNGSIYIWDQNTSQLNDTLIGHKNIVWTIVKLNNQSMASGSADTNIIIWRKENKDEDSSFKYFKTLLEQKSRVYSLVVLKDGRLLSAGEGSFIFIWEKETFKLINEKKEHTNSITGLAVLANNTFISVSLDQTFIIWNIDSLKKLESFNTNEAIWSMAVNSNDCLITGTSTGSINIWDTKSIDLLLLGSLQDSNLNHAASGLSLAFMRLEDDSLLLLSGSDNGKIKVWDTTTFKYIANLAEQSSRVTHIVSFGTQLFASSSSDNSIKLWEYYSDASIKTFKNIETIKHIPASILNLVVLNKTKLMSASIDKYIRIFNKSLQIKQINELKNHTKSVQDVVSLDGESLFASCSGDQTINIWNNSQVIKTLEGHTDYVYALEYSQSNKLLISGSKDSTIIVWNAESFTYNTTMYYHEDSVNSLLIVSNQTLASGSCDKTVNIWSLSTFRMVKSLKGHDDCVNTLTLYDSDQYLLSGSTDASIIIWDIINGFTKLEVLNGHQDSINSLIIHKEKIVSASSDKTIKIWSKYGFSFEETGAHNDLVWSMCVLNDGLIVSGSHDSTIKVWKQRNHTKLELVSALKDHNGIVWALKCLNSESFLSTSSDQTVKIWNKTNENTFKCTVTLNHTYSVTSVAVLSDLIISGDREGNIYIWNLTTLDNPHQQISFKGHDRDVWFIVSLNETSFASASDDTTIKVWRQSNASSLFECAQNLTKHTTTVYVLAVLNETKLISGSADGLIIVWCLISFELIQALKEHSLSVYGLAVLENGNFISVSKDKTIVIWDASTLMKITTLLDNSEVWSVAVYSNDTFVTGNSKKSIKVWSFSSKYKVIETLTDHHDEVLDLEVLNGAFLVSASEDGSIRVWDNFFRSYETKAHSKAVLSLNKFKNGTLISSSEDKSIKTWDNQQFILEKTFH